MLEERNGIIRGYAITVTRSGMDPHLQLMSTTTTITLNMLVAFTNYMVTVATSTSAGLGPPSPKITFTTAEDGNEISSLSIASENVTCSRKRDRWEICINVEL